MDILYIVGNGSKWGNNELRYSLRSIDMHGHGIDNVYLVGCRPDFVRSNVHFIPCADPYERKHKNIMHKIRYAIENSDIADHFLISSDDHFYNKDVDFENYPIYYTKEIPESYDASLLKNGYYKSMLQTRELLLRHDLPTYQTNPHVNTHFRKDLYLKHRHIFDEAMNLPNGGETNCIMGNLMIADGATPVLFSDSKLSDARYGDGNLFAERVRDVECFSMSDKALRFGIDKYLSHMFLHKSKYEI